MYGRYFIYHLVLTLVLLFSPQLLVAEVICIKQSISQKNAGKGKADFNKKISTTGRCPRGYGSERIYGDGSAGALNITTNTTLSSTNLQFTDITIPPTPL